MNPAFVVDTSVIASWLFEDEQSEYSESVLSRLDGESAIVPALCHLEVANVLVAAERRKRIKWADAARLLDFVRGLRLMTDDTPLESRIETIVALARTHALSAYDACYLELAMRLSLPLATLDRSLRNAAKEAGIPEFPGRRA